MTAKYRKLQEEVTQKLKNHAYSFRETVSIVGCGDKTLRRYIEAGLVRPSTSGAHSNSQYFTSEQVEQLCFIFDMQKLIKAPVQLSAALYDYMKARRMRFDIQNLLDRIEDYKNNRG